MQIDTYCTLLDKGTQDSYSHELVASRGVGSGKKPWVAGNYKGTGACSHASVGLLWRGQGQQDQKGDESPILMVATRCWMLSITQNQGG